MQLNDFILLENTINHDALCNLLDIHNFSRMKCYNMNDSSYEELEKYFLLIYYFLFAIILLNLIKLISMNRTHTAGEEIKTKTSDWFACLAAQTNLPM